MKNTKIAVIGLGYVGLPLSVEFAKKYEFVGFDINAAHKEHTDLKIHELNRDNVVVFDTKSVFYKRLVDSGL